MIDRRPQALAVIFDLDMTLVDTRIDLASAANAVRREFGLDPIPTATAISYIGDGQKALVSRALGPAVVGREEEAVASFRRFYGQHCLDTSRAFEGIVPLTAALRPLRLGVVSNKPEGFCRVILQGVGLGDRFDVVVGGDTTPALKPDPAPLIEACRRLEVAPEAAIMVGDTWRDVRVGKNAGSRTIAVTYGLDPRERLLQEGPDAIADTVAELGGAIAGWTGAQR